MNNLNQLRIPQAERPWADLGYTTMLLSSIFVLAAALLLALIIGLSYLFRSLRRRREHRAHFRNALRAEEAALIIHNAQLHEDV